MTFLTREPPLPVCVKQLPCASAFLPRRCQDECVVAALVVLAGLLAGAAVAYSPHSRRQMRRVSTDPAAEKRIADATFVLASFMFVLVLTLEATDQPRHAIRSVLFGSLAIAATIYFIRRR